MAPRSELWGEMTEIHRCKGRLRNEGRQLANAISGLDVVFSASAPYSSPGGFPSVATITKVTVPQWRLRNSSIFLTF